jgi:hypothetical protein
MIDEQNRKLPGWDCEDVAMFSAAVVCGSIVLAGLILLGTVLP